MNLKPINLTKQLSVLALLVGAYGFAINADYRIQETANDRSHHSHHSSHHEDGCTKCECKILHKVCEINEKLACDNAISFGSEDINKPGGFVICEPGIYCLKENVVFNPTRNAVTQTPVTFTGGGGSGAVGSRTSFCWCNSRYRYC